LTALTVLMAGFTPGFSRADCGWRCDAGKMPAFPAGIAQGFLPFSSTERPAEAGTPTGAAQEDGWSFGGDYLVRSWHPMRTSGLPAIANSPRKRL